MTDRPHTTESSRSNSAAHTHTKDKTMSTETRYKFKKGDRVRVIDPVPSGLRDDSSIIPGQLGTIEENESVIPFVDLDNGGRFPIWQKNMELITAKPEQPAAPALTPEPSAPLSPVLKAAEEPTQSFTKSVLTADARAFVNLHFPTDSHGKGGVYYHQLGVFAEFIESVFPDNT